MSKYEEALKNLSCDVRNLCKEMGWEMDNKDIEVMKELIQVKSDLEAKLAESEKRLVNCVDFNTWQKTAKENNELKQQLEYLENDHNKLIEQYDNQYNDLCKEIKVHSSARERFVKKVEELKQQLAEKDQTIETILEENEELVKKHNVYTWGDEIQQDKIYAITGEALEFLISNQDKISFAIAELDKVKEKIQEDRESLINYNNTSEVLMADGFLCDCKNFIDNQIAELTQHEDKGE